jgi:prepilin signal peptidase PulO-like enzyme (type II secretory pathway)
LRFAPSIAAWICINGLSEIEEEERWGIVWILPVEWMVLSIHKMVPVSYSDLLVNLFCFGKLLAVLFCLVGFGFRYLIKWVKSWILVRHYIWKIEKSDEFKESVFVIIK